MTNFTSKQLGYLVCLIFILSVNWCILIKLNKLYNSQQISPQKNLIDPNSESHSFSAPLESALKSPRHRSPSLQEDTSPVRRLGYVRGTLISSVVAPGYFPFLYDSLQRSKCPQQVNSWFPTIRIKGESVSTVVHLIVYVPQITRTFHYESLSFPSCRSPSPAAGFRSSARWKFAV